MKTGIPSPARSHGDPATPRRYITRRTRSVGSPARCNHAGRLSVLGHQLQEEELGSFVASPMTRYSVLNDNTNIELPQRQSWWKKLDETSGEIMAVLHSQNVDEGGNNILEDYIQSEGEVLSQEKKNYTLDLPESSDSDTINSIVLPQRKLFTQKDIPKQRFGKVIGARESLNKHQKSETIEKSIHVSPKKIFGEQKRQKSMFPANIDVIEKETFIENIEQKSHKIFGKESINNMKKSIKKNMADNILESTEHFEEPGSIFSTKLLASKKGVFKPVMPINISRNKTVEPNISKEMATAEAQIQTHNLFGNRATAKRKNIFADFKLYDSEEEIPEIETQAWKGFQRSVPKTCGSSASHGFGDVSPTSSVTTDIEMDDWNMLPSSTMIADKLEELAAGTPVKKIRLSILAPPTPLKIIDEHFTENKTNEYLKDKSKVSCDRQKVSEVNNENITLNYSKQLENNAKNTPRANIGDRLTINYNAIESKNKTMIAKNTSQHMTNDITINKNQSQVSTSKFILSNINIKPNQQHSADIQKNKSNDCLVSESIRVEPDIEEIDDDEPMQLTYEHDEEQVEEEALNQRDIDVLQHKTEEPEHIQKIPITKEIETNLEFATYISNQNVPVKDTQTEANRTGEVISKVTDSSKESQQELKNKSEIQKTLLELFGQEKDITLEEEIISQAESILQDDLSEIQQETTDGIEQQEEKEKSIRNENKESMVQANEITNNTPIELNNEINIQNEGILANEEEHLQNEENKDNEKANESLMRNFVNEEAAQGGTIKYSEIKNNSKQEIEKHNEAPKQSGLHSEGEPEENDNVFETPTDNEQDVDAESETECEQEDNADVDEQHNQSEAQIEEEDADVYQSEVQVEEEDDEVYQSGVLVEEEDEEVCQSEEQIEEDKEVYQSETPIEDVEEENEQEELNESEVQSEDENLEQTVAEDEDNNQSDLHQDDEDEKNLDQTVAEDEDNNQSDLHQDDEDEKNLDQTVAEDEDNNQSDLHQDDEDENNLDQTVAEDEDNQSNLHHDDEDEKNLDQTVAEDNNQSDLHQDDEDEQEGEIEQSMESEINDDNNDEANASDENLEQENFKESDANQKDPENSPIEIAESPNVTHDTTGRHRKKINETKVKTPEALRKNISNIDDSITTRGRNTTKSINPLELQPNIASVRDSIGSEGSNFSAQGSGWDSHRTTRKTLRQTFGKDFTPRKSLRTLVMEKSAKRQTEAEQWPKKSLVIPLANSTKIVTELSDHHINDEEFSEVSDHEESRVNRLEELREKLKLANMARKQEIENKIQASLNSASTGLNHIFKVPLKPSYGARRGLKAPKVQSNPKATKRSAVPLGELPIELKEELKYKPPKRFAPSNASWATNRLYKFLETKLEPHYDYMARVRAEKLVQSIYNFTKFVRRHDSVPRDIIDELKREMARLKIVRTHHDFYQFFHDFMPREIRTRVNPDVVNKYPLPRRGVFSDIIPESDLRA